MAVEEEKATQSPCYKSPLLLRVLAEGQVVCRNQNSTSRKLSASGIKSVGFKIYLKLIHFSLSPWSASIITHWDQHSSLLPGPTAPAKVPHSLSFPKQPEGTCEHVSQVTLLCPQLSRAPTFLRVKIQVLW